MLILFVDFVDLWVQGASLAKGQLSLSSAAEIKVPSLKFKWIQGKGDTSTADVVLPIYSSPDRDSMLGKVHVSGPEADAVYLHGAALIANFYRQE